VHGCLPTWQNVCLQRYNLRRRRRGQRKK
jgi:hypothetical protein